MAELTMDQFNQLVDDEEVKKFTLSNADFKRVQTEFLTAREHALAIRDKYAGKKESLTPTEHEEFDRAIADAEQKGILLKQAQKWAKIEAFSAQSSNALGIGNRDGRTVSGNDSPNVKAYNALHLKAFREYLRASEGINSKAMLVNNPTIKRFMSIEDQIPDDDDASPISLKTYLKASWTKAYQSDNPAGFGFAVPPQELVQAFITLMKDLVYIRGMATKYAIPRAESLGAPAIDTDPSDDDWTSELAVGNEETTVAVGKRELKPSPLAKYIKLSKKLLRQVPQVENVVMDRLAYKVGITEEKAFLNGTGADQPLGVFVATSNGISTARDTTAGTTTAVAGDDFIQTFYKLKKQYRQQATWIMHRDVVKSVRLLKDTTNNYLWTAGYGTLQGLGPGGGLEGSNPDLLMGRPILESEYAPNTFTTGLYMAIVGAFSNYWIADALDMQIQVLYELFALNNQMGYILRKETDGMPVLEEAFQRLRLQ